MRTAVVAALVVLVVASVASLPLLAQQSTDQPATRPAGGRSAEEMLNQMLQPSSPDAPRQLDPSTNAGATDATSGPGAVAPGAPPVTVLRERSFIVDRTGRLARGEDGQQWEFRFDADGQSLQDPPVLVLPNLTLMAMENQVAATSRDLRFRITGEVTEYRGRNYVLLRKAVVLPEGRRQF
jgi:hypothetical protein